MKRKIKSLFNKLTETNFQFILKSLEAIYQTNPRSVTNELVYQTILQNLVNTSALTNERLVLESLLILSCLHVKIGPEVTSYFLENLSMLLMKCLEDVAKNCALEDKTLDNYSLIIAHTYNYKLISASFVCDLLRRYSAQFSDKTIECTFIVFKAAGAGIRKDDPVSFKDIITNVQLKIISTVSSAQDP